MSTPTKLEQDTSQDAVPQIGTDSGSVLSDVVEYPHGIALVMVLLANAMSIFLVRAFGGMCEWLLKE